MGSKQSQVDPPTAADAAAADDDGNIYYLKKRRPGCTGMFWRSDPTGRGPKLASNNDWPRDHAMLKGQVVTHGGEKWLLATQVRQANDAVWKTAPIGAAMPFAYDDHYYLDTQAP
jgi:hypothetical protein